MDSHLSGIERSIFFLGVSIRCQKKFYSSKEAILLDSVDLSKIVVPSRCKINDKTYKPFGGYLNNNSIKPLCVILPQVDDG